MNPVWLAMINTVRIDPHHGVDVAELATHRKVKYAFRPIPGARA
jgi:hypothetical protein